MGVASCFVVIGELPLEARGSVISILLNGSAREIRARLANRI